MTLPVDNLDKETWFISIKQTEYTNLKRAARWVKLLNEWYTKIVNKLIQFKKPEEKEAVLEEVRQMVVGVKRELDK